MSSLSDIVVVSGLPRSGTSLCMRMLEAGGVPVVVDHCRRADDDNPNGYYEFEAVKRTRVDDSWLSYASGKAVKMVYRLLYDLPDRNRYRVLFMRRDMDEILKSQQKMLQRKGRQDSTVSNDEMRGLFERELHEAINWIKAQKNFRLLEVDYNSLLEAPAPALEAMNDFLNHDLNIPAMTQVIDPSLYRNRCRTEALI